MLLMVLDYAIDIYQEAVIVYICIHILENILHPIDSIY